MDKWGYFFGGIALTMGVTVVVVLIMRQPMLMYQPQNQLPQYQQISVQNEATYEAVRDERGRLQKYIVHREIKPIEIHSAE